LLTIVNINDTKIYDSSLGNNLFEIIEVF